MIRFKSKTIFTASCLILISCHFHSRNDLGAFQKWNSKKYSFLYPAGWQMDSSGKLGAPLIIYSLKESPADKFAENIALTINPFPDSLSDKDLEVDETKVSGLGDILVFKKEVLSDSTIFYHVEYAAKGSLSMGVQGMWVSKHEAYQLICTCEKDKFEKYREIFNKVLKSFTLIN
jgi:hypothetical protein